MGADSPVYPNTIIVKASYPILTMILALVVGGMAFWAGMAFERQKSEKQPQERMPTLPAPAPPTVVSYDGGYLVITSYGEVYDIHPTLRPVGLWNKRIVGW